jgi:starvation-inducible DNA-binding protein
MGHYMMGDQPGKAELAVSLGRTLSTAYVFLVKVAGFHWNVKGPDFSEYHELFQEIYDDVDGMIDPTAENILKMGYDAPASFTEFLSMTKIADGQSMLSDPIQMCADLLDANEILIAQINESFSYANAANEQGIADFLAGRDDMHKKWSWQLRSIVGSQRPRKLSNADAGYPTVTAEPVIVVEAEPVQTEPVAVSSDCPYCTAEGCSCIGGYCQCDDSCQCGCKSDMMILAAASKPAPKKDRIYGSKKNPKGSASGGKKITFSAKTETALRNKMEEHNKNAPNGRKTTMAQLKAVYRRGAGAYSSSHRPGKTRDQWAMARVNAYLRLLKSGRPANANYKQDNDLLPASHPRSSREAGMTVTASGALDVEILDEHDYSSPEEAIFAFAEFSDQGYEIIPALRTAWLRAVENGDNPYNRARELAVSLYRSRDADLLPRKAD